LVHKYSEFINFPIYIRVKRESERDVPVEEDDSEKPAGEEGEAEEKSDDDLDVSDADESNEEKKVKTKKVKDVSYEWE